MSYSQRNRTTLPSSWLELNAAAVQLLFAATVLLGSASLLAMASGEPETMVLVAVAGVGVVLLGTALVRASERLRSNESLPLRR